MKHTLPTPFFLERFRSLYGRTFEPSSTNGLAIRVNTLKSSPKEVTEMFDKLTIAYETVPWWENAYFLPGLTGRDITKMGLYLEGKIYIQSLSSMIPPLVLSPKRSDRVLDMAAAPGSKTSELAALMENGGQIIANDIDRRRLYKLNAVLDILGVKNVSVTSRAGQSLWKEFPEVFDKVLLDAPCSMEGTLYYPGIKKIAQLSKLQRWLLRSAVSAAKPGGEILYSTCSMAPEENEEVIDWILKKEGDSIELGEINLAVPQTIAGITSWQGHSLEPGLSKTLRIPGIEGMEPFFIARILKKASTVGNVA